MNSQLNLRDFQISKKEQKSIQGGYNHHCLTACENACNHYIPTRGASEEAQLDNAMCNADCYKFCK